MLISHLIIKIFTNLDNISKYSQIVLVILIFLFLLQKLIVFKNLIK